LNPGGVRIGTAEIYRVAEAMDEINDSLVIGQSWEGDQRIVLFIKMRTGFSFTDVLVSQLKNTIKSQCSPRHVPSIVLEVKDIPYTINGKKVEIAIRKIIDGQPVGNKDALANPGSLDLYKNIPELKG